MITHTSYSNLPIVHVLSPCNINLQKLHHIEVTIPIINTSVEEKIKTDISNQSSKKGNLVDKQKLYIKNMVSLRCKMAVKEELRKLGLELNASERGTTRQLQPVGSCGERGARGI